MLKAPDHCCLLPFAITTAFLLFSSPSKAQIVGGETETLFRFNGRAEGELFGTSSAAAGDINGDGTMDIMVAGYMASPGGLTGAGSVLIYSGSDGSVLYHLDGTQVDEFFGTAISGAGDINQDGYDDFLICASGANPSGLTDAGTATLFSGFDASILLQIHGQIENGGLGRSVSNVGDLDGDGVNDIVLGSPGAHAAAAYSSITGAVIHTWSGFAGAPNPRFGMAVAGAGDTNNDGFEDIIIGDDFVGNGGSGAAYLYSGDTGLLLHKWNGAPGDGLGRSLAGVGDLNQDGFADVLVGAPWSDASGLPSAGYAKVYSGATGLTLFEWFGDTAYGNLGYATSSAGDVNGDGFSDLLIGAYSHHHMNVFSGVDGALLFSYAGEEGSRMGRSGAALGDLNNDGRDDVIVTAYRNDLGGLSDVGSAFVFSFHPLLEANTQTVSASAGGTVDFSIRFADAFSGQSYATLISAAGEGMLQRGVAIPLLPDAFTRQSMQGNYPVSTHLGMLGVLDVLGHANASITFPAGMSTSLIGRSLWFAAVTHAFGELPNASSVAVPITVSP